ncbi:MAG: hypothetical protein JWP91_2837 [Fibrobacteres bacterium]|nr:hypothetical protein [Fibrobacterota bacterium]
MCRAIPGGLKALLAVLACLPCLFLSRCNPAQVPGKEEKYVTVKLNDSLSRFDSVQVLILAAGDTNQVVGKLWDGHLAEPSGIPPFRLDDAEGRDLSVRVMGFDAYGRLTLDMLISKQDGKQVIVNATLPKPSPDLASLQISPGALTPAFAPSVKEYAVSLPYDQDELGITLIPKYAPATVRVGTDVFVSGSAGKPVDLEVGLNRLVINVTAADTSTQYVLNATRARQIVPVDTTPVDTVKPPADTTKLDILAWKHKAMLVPNFKQVGIGKGSLVTGFPILIRLEQTGAFPFNFMEAAADGADIRFTTADNRILPHEITRWDQVKGDARVWVRFDTLNSSNDSGYFMMYWGNAAAVTTSDPAKVFPPGQWSGVWHLEESSLGAFGDFKDATGRFNGTGGGFSKGQPVRRGGECGYGQDFKSTNDQAFIRLPEEYDPGKDAWTMHMWVKREGVEPGVLFNKADGTTANQQRFQLNSLATGQRLSLSRAGANFLTTVYLPQDNFILIGVVYNGTKASVYVNGAFKESLDWTQGPHAFAKTYLGASDARGTDGFHGILDEVWSSSKAQSSAYMRLIFESQKLYSDFISILPL